MTEFREQLPGRQHIFLWTSAAAQSSGSDIISGSHIGEIACQTCFSSSGSCTASHFVRHWRWTWHRYGTSVAELFSLRGTSSTYCCSCRHKIHDPGESSGQTRYCSPSDCRPHCENGCATSFCYRRKCTTYRKFCRGRGISQRTCTKAAQVEALCSARVELVHGATDQFTHWFCFAIILYRAHHRHWRAVSVSYHVYQRHGRWGNTLAFSALH